MNERPLAENLVNLQWICRTHWLGDTSDLQIATIRGTGGTIRMPKYTVLWTAAVVESTHGTHAIEELRFPEEKKE